MYFYRIYGRKNNAIITNLNEICFFSEKISGYREEFE